MKLEFNMNPTADDARMERYLRGVRIVHDLTRFERAELLLFMGYTPKEVAQHFPVPRTLTHEDERACMMQPIADGIRVQSDAEPQPTPAVQLHPQKKAMMHAMYALGEKLAGTESYGAEFDRDQYLALLLKTAGHVPPRDHDRGRA